MLLPLSGRPRRELCKVAASIQGTTEDKAELAEAPRLTDKIGIKKEWEGGVGGATGATEVEREMQNRPAGSVKICGEKQVIRGEFMCLSEAGVSITVPPVLLYQQT